MNCIGGPHNSKTQEKREDYKKGQGGLTKEEVTKLKGQWDENRRAGLTTTKCTEI